MALLARRVYVHPGQLEAAHRMIKVLLVDPGSFPTGGRVALGAICSKPPLVLVFVARYTAGREAEPGVIQILGAQQGALRLGDVLRIMT
jgi:hypothetical protein